MKKSAKSVSNQLEWLDLIKAFALILIFINHIGENIFGAPYIANPSAEWPSLGLRVAQLTPLKGYGFATLFLNLFRYTSWIGDHGVQLFLVASGFGLTWSLLKQDSLPRMELGKFYKKRLVRIFPLWIGVHIFYAVLTFIAGWEGWGLHLTDPKFLLSILGFRVTPGMLYYFSPAWWFFGLLLQLYFVFPFLWWILKKIGPAKLLWMGSLITLLIRGIGLYIFTDYLDAWSRGAVFVTRLPEFIFGISFAYWYYTDQQGIISFIKRPSTLLVSLCILLTGLLVSLTLFGMTFAYFLVGISTFALLFAWFVSLKSSYLKIRESGIWLGEHSYSIYLVHHPLIFLFVSFTSGLIGILVAIVSTLIVSVGLEKVIDWILNFLQRSYQRTGFLRTIFLAGSVPVILYLLLLGGELFIQRVDPMEVIGWGERPSLTPDPVLGYRMKPSQVIRLRWESYDYVVFSNSLGFPGPEYPTEKNNNTFRIMTVGDAFTSAEGVNTENAWPRLLEKDLTSSMPNKKVEVLNFGITGYGPNQYAAVVDKYAPIYSPDLIVVGFFVNDYQDVEISNEEFQQSIGFGLPSPNGWYATSRLFHLRKFVDKRILEKISHTIRGEIDYYGYFLGNFSSLERRLERNQENSESRRLVLNRLNETKVTADRINADVYILMIPAPVQVCDSSAFDYYPKGVDLSDTEKFDINLPQRTTKEIADTLNIKYIDLRDLLKSLENCPYQPKNMHWTYSGHVAVADYVAKEILYMHP